MWKVSWAVEVCIGGPMTNELDKQPRIIHVSNYVVIDYKLSKVDKFQALDKMTLKLNWNTFIEGAPTCETGSAPADPGLCPIAGGNTLNFSYEISPKMTHQIEMGSPC